MNKAIAYLTRIAFPATILGFLLLFLFVFIIRILNLSETPLILGIFYFIMFGSAFFFGIGTINSLIQVVKNK